MLINCRQELLSNSYVCLYVGVKTFFPAFSSCYQACSCLLTTNSLPWKLALYCLSQFYFILLIYFLHTAADDLTKSLLHHLPLCYATEITSIMKRPRQQFITYVLCRNELAGCGIYAQIHTHLENPMQLPVVGLRFLLPSAVKIKEEKKYLLYIYHILESQVPWMTEMPQTFF